MLVKTEIINNLIEEANLSFEIILNELDNNLPFESKYPFLDLKNIDQQKINIEIEKMNVILKAIKGLKEFNPKKE